MFILCSSWEITSSVALQQLLLASSCMRALLMAVAVVGVSSIVESSSLSGAELGTDLLFLGVLVDFPGENGTVA